MADDETTRDQVTEILRRATTGDRAALDQVLPIVYDELRGMAANYLRRERPGHTLGPTALAHEAYLKLKQADVRWKSHAHLLAAAAQAMRHILVDYARARAAAKRGNGQILVPLEEVHDAAPERASWVDLIDLDRALVKLAQSQRRCEQVVELLYFGGLTAAEAGEVLDVSERTVERDWRFGRARLLQALEGRSPS